MAEEKPDKARKIIMPYEKMKSERLIFPEGNATAEEIYSELEENATTRVQLEVKSGDVYDNFNRYQRAIGQKAPGTGLIITGMKEVGGMALLYSASLSPDECAYRKHPGIDRQKIRNDFAVMPWNEFSDRYMINFSDTLYLVKMLLTGKKPRKVQGKILNTEFEQRFIREGNVMMDIDSPYIPKVIYADKNFIGMKYIPYTIPIQALKKDDRTLEERVVIGENMFKIFADINERRAKEGKPTLHHRDVTGTNILVMKPGIPDLSVYVVDLGLVSNPNFPMPSEEKKEMLVTGENVIGTPSYIPPEVASTGELKLYTNDVYSLGIVFYGLMLGELPFKGFNPNKILGNIITWNDGKGPMLPHVLDPRIPLPLSNFIMKAISRNPRDRFMDVIDAYNTLRSIREDISFTHSDRAGVVSSEEPRGIPTLVISEVKRVEEEKRRKAQRSRDYIKRTVKEDMVKDGKVEGDMPEKTIVIGNSDEDDDKPKEYYNPFTGKRTLQRRLRFEDDSQ